MQMSQISFSNELYSGGDVVARGDQSSDDSVYEVQHNSSNSRIDRTRKHRILQEEQTSKIGLQRPAARYFGTR